MPPKAQYQLRSLLQHDDTAMTREKRGRVRHLLSQHKDHLRLLGGKRNVIPNIDLRSNGERLVGYSVDSQSVNLLVVLRVVCRNGVSVCLSVNC